ncbi:MAG: FAD-dependent oxidoreductase [Opitutaceae bacterium]
MTSRATPPSGSTADSQPWWLENVRFPEFPRLDRDLQVDVVVIGGGITGITTAFLLKRAGHTVALLERGRCASVDTGFTTAHLTCVPDIGVEDLILSFGKDAARAVWEAGSAAVDQIEALVREESIDCGFHRVSTHIHAPRDADLSKEAERLNREADLARSLGFPAQFVREAPFFGTPAMEVANQALFHPRKYLAALAAEIPGEGCYLFENTAADEVESEPLTVVAGDKHRIQCSHVVIATHNPVMGKSGMIGSLLFQTKLSLYTSYALSATIPKGLIPTGSYWDTNDPYYYLRAEPAGDSDLAIYGGEDHKTGQREDTREPFAKLQRKFLELVPQATIDHRWSGQVIETSDRLPYIGETDSRQFIATGYAGNGMTFGTLAAMMAVDARQGRANPWSELFSPGRKKIIGSAIDYMLENKDYPLLLARDWLRRPGDSLDDVAPGEGRVLKLEGKRVAAHRDKEGNLTLCSAVCPHLQCIVAWNKAEGTWDCPCHGSRFTATGAVISGPAESDLERIPVKA